MKQDIECILNTNIHDYHLITVIAFLKTFRPDQIVHSIEININTGRLFLFIFVQDLFCLKGKEREENKDPDKRHGQPSDCTGSQREPETLFFVIRS